MRKLPKEINLYICYNNYQVQGVIAEPVIDDVTVMTGEFDTIKLTIPKYIPSTDDPTKLEINNGYKLIKDEKLIYLEDCGYFIAKKISVDESVEEHNVVKVVECYGLEYRLSKKNVIFNTTTIQLKSNAVDPTPGVFDRLEEETGWKLRMIDEIGQYDFINGGKSLKYRYFDGVAKSWWGFLIEEVQQAFDVVVFFDNLKREIYCYGRATFGELTNLYVSRDNYRKALSRVSDSQDIITRLYATGKDGLTFNSLNPLGTQYIEDFSHFRNSDYMSQELLTALDAYYPELNTMHAIWKDNTGVLLGLQSAKIPMDETLMSLKEEEKVLKTLQTTYAKEGNEQMMLKTKEELVAKQLEISNQEEVIEEQVKKIEDQQKVILSICERTQRENIVDSQGRKIFTPQLLEELDNFTYESNWSNDTCITEEGLLSSAKQQLASICKPQTDFSVGLEELFFNDFKDRINTEPLDESRDSELTVEEYFIEQCGLGHFIMVEGSEGIDMVRLLGYSYTPGVNGELTSASLTLSTKDFRLSFTGSLGNAISASNNVSRQFNANKMSLDKARENAGWIDEYYQNALDVKEKNVFASQGRNKVLINENGIWTEDGKIPDNVTYITSGGILISDDGMTTARTAIDAYGIVAEELIGKILIGEKLYISDNNGEIELLGNLLTIRDDSMKVRAKLGEYDKLKKKYGLQLFDKNGAETVLDEDGIVQRERIMETDNLDNTYPMKVFVPIDEGIREVRQADIYIFPQKFRGYTKSATTYIGEVVSAGASTNNSSGASSISSSGASSTTSSSSGGGGTTSDNPLSGTTLYLITQSNEEDHYVPGKHYHEVILHPETFFNKAFIHNHTITPHTHNIQHTHNIEHTHNIQHTHIIDIPPHTHELVHGIYEYNVNPTLQLFVNGEQIGGDINTDSCINIRKYLKLNSNNYIEIRSNTLARATVNLVLKCMASY